MQKIKNRTHCPISFSLDIFGDKWSLLIIRDLMFSGFSTYSEFLNSDEKIATNILAHRLSLLEHAKIISKKRDKKNKAKYIYSLTQKGIDLLPTLIEIIRWGKKHDPKSATPKDFMKALKKDKVGLIKETSRRLKKEMLV